MTLRKLITEKYQAKQIDVFEAEFNILDKLRNYLIPKDSKIGIPLQARYGLEDGFGEGIYFIIPSINAFLSSSVRFDSKGRDRGGGKFYNFSNPPEFTSEIEVDFSYLEGTSEEDLFVIRGAIKDARLEQLAESK